MGKRVPLNEGERRLLVKYGLPIKDRLDEIISVKTRRVPIAGCTPYPDAAWVRQQARNFFMLLEDIDEKCRYVIHDRDNSFAGFDFILKTEGIKIVKTPPKAP
ncbi:MAG: hypothetical protein PVI54_06225, partial [Desulfobacteraceae bacterium]